MYYYGLQDNRGFDVVWDREIPLDQEWESSTWMTRQLAMGITIPPDGNLALHLLDLER